MKTIISYSLLLIILLSLFSCKSEHDINMPQKLIFNERPANYPEELEGLFKFFYDTSQEIIKIVEENSSTNESNRNIASIIVKEMSLEEIRRITYLDWLAKNEIFAYYNEFMLMNNGSNYLKTPEDKRKFLYIPDGYFEKKEYTPWFPSVMIRVKLRYFKEIKENRIVENFNDTKFIYGRIKRIKDIEEYPRYKDYEIYDLEIDEPDGTWENVYYINFSDRDFEIEIGKYYLFCTYTPNENYFSHEHEKVTVKYFNLFANQANTYEVINGVVKGLCNKPLTEILPENSYYKDSKTLFSDKYIFEAPINEVMKNTLNLGSRIKEGI